MTLLTRSHMVSALAAAAHALAPEIADAELLALDRRRAQLLALLDDRRRREPVGGKPAKYAKWERKTCELDDELQDLDERIARTPAAGMMGLAVKLRVAGRDLPPVPWSVETVTDRALRGVLADLERIAG